MKYDACRATRRAKLVAVAVFLAVATSAHAAETPPAGNDPAAVKMEDGKYSDKNGNPTYKVLPDGTVDFYTYAGFVRYSANCLQCHGPDGMGSSYAPSLVNSLQALTYLDFLTTVASGKRDVTAAQTLVMPMLGDNKNVMCYLDAIYIYLRARSDDVVGRGRPPKHQPKPPAFAEAENQCMG